MGTQSIKKVLKRKKVKGMKKLLQKIMALIVVIVFLFTTNKVSEYINDLYGSNNNTDEFGYYVKITDELSRNKAQLNWKELFAIEYVKVDGDLKKISKKDLINLSEEFLVEIKRNEYKVNTIENVMDEINLSKQDKKKVYLKLEELKNEYMNGKKMPDEKVKFIMSLENEAINIYKKHRILPSITVGQAILESGWGDSYLTKEGNNLFGIKADKRWNGSRVSVNTKENYNDKIIATFRSYDSIQESIRDYGVFLSTNKRYADNGVFKAKDYIAQAEALEKAGYSTKKNKSGELIYADILIELIRNYNLQMMDTKVNRIE